MSRPIKDVDFRFCPVDVTKLGVGIELLTGKYAGVKYVYGGVKALENPDNKEELFLNFDYVIADDAGHETKKLEMDEGFGMHIGSILQEIIIGELDQKIKEEETDNGPAT